MKMFRGTGVAKQKVDKLKPYKFPDLRIETTGTHYDFPSLSNLSSPLRMRCHNEYHGLNISLYAKVFEFEPHGGCSSGRFALVGVGSSSLNRMAVVRVLSSSSVLFQRCWCSSGRIALVRVFSLESELLNYQLELITRTS